MFGGKNKRQREGSASTPSKRVDDKVSPQKMDSKEANIQGGSLFVDLPDQELNKIGSQALGGAMEDGAAGSYSDAAKKKKRQFPYAVYCLRENHDNKGWRLTQKCFSTFLDSLFQARLKMEAEENEKLKIEWTAINDGVGIIATEDAASASWVKSQSRDFLFQAGKESETKISVWARWERAQAVVLMGYLHGIQWKHCKPRKALNDILKISNLKGEFAQITWDNKTPNGVFMTFEPSEELLQAIQGRNMTLNGGICRVKLEKRLRKQRTEEEYLAFLGEDTGV